MKVRVRKSIEMSLSFILLMLILGFSAHYCTYSLQSLETNQILSTWVASKHVVSVFLFSIHKLITDQVKSSAAMEPYCCKSLLINLQEEFNLTPDSLTTDRSTTMKSMIRLDVLNFINFL